MIIEVLGKGCPKCEAVEKNVLEALKELGLKAGEDASVAKVKDIKMISARGVMMTPAVMIDGVKMSEGRIPEVKEIKEWLKNKR